MLPPLTVKNSSNSTHLQLEKINKIETILLTHGVSLHTPEIAEPTFKAIKKTIKEEGFALSDLFALFYYKMNANIVEIGKIFNNRSGSYIQQEMIRGGYQLRSRSDYAAVNADEAVMLFEQGKTIGQIALELAVSESAIKTSIRRHPQFKEIALTRTRLCSRCQKRTLPWYSDAQICPACFHALSQTKSRLKDKNINEKDILTSRNKEILRLKKAGVSVKEIASQISRNPEFGKIVPSRVYQILWKLEALESETTLNQTRGRKLTLSCEPRINTDLSKRDTDIVIEVLNAKDRASAIKNIAAREATTPANIRRILDRHRNDSIIDAFNHGKKPRDIAKSLNVSSDTVFRIIYQQRVELNFSAQGDREAILLYCDYHQSKDTVSASDARSFLQSRFKRSHKAVEQRNEQIIEWLVTLDSILEKHRSSPKDKLYGAMRDSLKPEFLAIIDFDFLTTIQLWSIPKAVRQMLAQHYVISVSTVNSIYFNRKSC